MPSAARLNHRHQPSTTSTVSSSSSSSSTRPALQRILTNSPSNAVNLSRSTAPTSRRVRSHWFSHFVAQWRRSSRTSKFMLASSLTLVAIQMIATVVVLTFSWEMYCDKPLRIFLTVYILRLFMAAPLSLYLHFAPRRQQQQHRQIQIMQQQQQQPSSLQPHPQPIVSIPTTAASADRIIQAEAGEAYVMTERRSATTTAISTGASDPSTSAAAAVNPSATSSLPTTQHSLLDHDTVLTNWIDRAKSALDVFSFLWFIIGNYMLFTSTTCSETAVPLYYFSFVVIIYGYIILSVPILLCTAVIFCLPCVLVGMRILHVDDAVDMGGASSEEIAKIPVYKFKSTSSVSSAVITTAATTTTTAAAAVPSRAMDAIEMQELPKKAQATSEPLGFWEHLWVQVGLVEPESNESHDEPVYATIEIPNEQDRVCAICLSTYDDGDILCQLWCNHHFHKTCVHEWLVLNSRCPMCKRDSRGKEYPDQLR